MYTNEIIWFLLWPVLIYVSYLIIRWAVRYQDKKLGQ